MTTAANDERRSLAAVIGAAVALVCAGWPGVARAQTEAPEVPASEEPPVTSPAPAPRIVAPSTPAPPARTKEATPAPGDGPRPPSAPDGPGPDAVPAVVEPRVSASPAWSIAPGARLDIDGGVFHRGPWPPTALLVRRARVQVMGWIGSQVFFSAAAEYAAPPGQPSVFAPADVFLAVAPRGPLLVLQAGQFDAPFTLENRTVDSTLDFLERSIAIRAFGIPENKATGAMLTGTDGARRFHYALGVFDGDGASLRSLDDQYDFMARAWLAPFSFNGAGPLRALSFGGSFWTGDRENALPLDPQTTSGGWAFARFDPYTTTTGGPPRQLRQVGRRYEAAIELEAPIDQRFGARGEIVWRWSPLSEEDVTDPTHPTILGAANLDGWAAYGAAWFWVMGDDRSAPGARRGLEPYGAPTPAPGVPDGVMLALRVSHLDEQVWQDTDAALLNLGDPAVGVTRVTSYELGVNYWHARAFRATCNYILNHVSGTTAEVKSLATSTEQELLVRLAIAL